MPPAAKRIPKIDVVFVGSCTNGRISDLRLAAKVLAGRKVADGVRVMVVPGSQEVKKQAENEGLAEVFRAAGAETRRLAFGHHGANHPVRDLPSGRVYVTAQNHEVEVVGDTIPASSGFHVSQINLNDRSVEGLRHAELPIETVQYHPEGSPGPLDATPVFDRFSRAIEARR